MASPTVRCNLFESSSAVTSGCFGRMDSLMYALLVGYITDACTVSTRIDQSFSFVNCSRFIVIPL